MTDQYLLGFITILLGVIGFFLVKFIKSVESMEEAVDSLKITISVFTEKFSSNSKDHEVTERRLNEHAKRLDEHDRAITELKVKVK